MTAWPLCAGHGLSYRSMNWALMLSGSLLALLFHFDIKHSTNVSLFSSHHVIRLHYSVKPRSSATASGRHFQFIIVVSDLVFFLFEKRGHYRWHMEMNQTGFMSINIMKKGIGASGQVMQSLCACTPCSIDYRDKPGLSHLPDAPSHYVYKHSYIL